MYPSNCVDKLLGCFVLSIGLYKARHDVQRQWLSSHQVRPCHAHPTRDGRLHWLHVVRVCVPHHRLHHYGPTHHPLSSKTWHSANSTRPLCCGVATQAFCSLSVHLKQRHTRNLNKRTVLYV